MEGFLLPFSACVRHTHRDYSITLIQEVSMKRNQQSLETWLKEGDRSIKLQFAFRWWAVWKLQILSAFLADLRSVKQVFCQPLNLWIDDHNSSNITEKNSQEFLAWLHLEI